MDNQHLVTLARYDFICSELASTPIVDLAHASGVFESEEEATAALSGLLQWLALPSYCSFDSFPLVMMTGPVAKLFDCFAGDEIFYTSFCQRYMGYTLHAIPVTLAFQQKYVIEQGWIQATIDSLNNTFGADLAPVLCDWPRMKRDSDPVFVGMFPDQLHRHYKLVPERMLQKLWQPSGLGLVQGLGLTTS